MKQTCQVCNHPMKTHNKSIRDPQGNPGPDAGKICLVSVGSGPMGFDMSCSCNGKRCLSKEFMK